MIEVRAVWKRMPVSGRAPLEILRGVSFQLQRGEAAAMFGPSGAGKTTLLNLIAAVDQPSQGSIEVAGIRVDGLAGADAARYRRDTVGMVFQSYHLLPQLPAIENAALPLYLKGLPRAQARKRAAECLDWVGLSERTAHLPEELSGGERQRVAIARAIAGNPPVLLADEPTGSLDSETGKHVLDLLMELHRRLGTTMLLVTHDEAVADRCGQILRLRDGQLEGQVQYNGDQTIEDSAHDSA